MLNIQDILANREYIEKALSKRMDRIDFSELIDWKKKQNSLRGSIDENRRVKKTLSTELSKKLARKEDDSDIRARIQRISDEIDDEERQFDGYSVKIKEFLELLPNIPEDEVPAGGKESNQVLEVIGTKPIFPFNVKDHVELGTSLNLVNYEKGVKLGGRGKWVYWGDGAMLEWALINYFISTHAKNEYRFVLPPHLLGTQAGYAAGQFPKFEKDVFYISSEDKDNPQFLIPTAETALVSLYRDEIIPYEELPIKLFAYTPCYRNEAFGSHSNERGTVRGYQFNKVEIVHFARPEESESCFQEIVRIGKDIMDGLGLHYRISRLAARDCSHSMAKTYDIEVWIPSMNEYREVSSISTAHTYQAVRGNIRYKDTNGKTRFVHTLNGSALATSRVFPAILEQYQQKDGRILVPKVLQPMIGKEYLG